MQVICDSCGTENPPGTRFCVNPHCQAYLAWSERDAGALVDPAGPPSSSAAVKPGSLHPAGSHRSPGSDLAAGPPPPQGITLTAAPTHPAQLVEPSPPGKVAQPALPATARRRPRYEFIRETQAPVAVKPVEEPVPDRPPGQGAANGKHGLWFGLDQHVLAVEPGRRASVGAQVANKGSVVEGVDIRVLGVPEEWVRVEPPRVNLDVGGQASLLIHFAPPKATTTRSGPAEVEVAVWSVSSPKVRCAEHVRLDVGSYSDLEILHAPHELTVRRSGEFELLLRNNGNAPTEAEARPRPGSPVEGKVQLKFEPRLVTIPPGHQTAVTVQARAARRLWTGTPATHPLQIDVVRAGETNVNAIDVKMVQQPLLPRWAPKVLAVLTLVVLVAGGLGVRNWYKHRPVAVPSVINQPVDLATANLSKAGFKGVPINAANPTVAVGTVFHQDPPAGAHRHPGTVIAITVSSGAPTVKVGDVSQLSQQQAVATLRHQGLKVRILMAASPTLPAGLVTAQSPAPSVAVPVGSTVDITVTAPITKANKESK
jgi:hypothetical protein